MPADIYNLSDEDFLSASRPEDLDAVAAGNGGTPATEPAADTVQGSSSDADQPPAANADPLPGSVEDTSPSGSGGSEPVALDEENKSGTVAAGASEDAGANDTQSGADASATGAAPAEGAPADGTQAAPQKKEGEEQAQTAPNYEALYQEIMKPFKANGRMIELKSPAEAIALMQMGANYTRKMQEIAPHRKALMMLQTHGLLDENQLSFAIDLVVKKNPDAIRKLVKEAGIDPLETDLSGEPDPSYRPDTNKLSDEEVAFQTALDDLKTTDSGRETLKAIHSEWDNASKQLLFQSPEVLNVIHQQRELGVYDRIVAEMERRRTLGLIAPTVPFLQAYHDVGNQLQAAGAFNDLADKILSQGSPQATTTPAVQQTVPTPQARPQPTPVATTVAAPKPAVTNSERASAAAPTRTSPPKRQEFVNPLAMSDDEFLKRFEGRV